MSETTNQPPSTDRLRAVIFDVDGTLVDSERDGHRVAFNEAFADAGLPYRWDVDDYGLLLRITGGERRIRSFLLHKDHDADEAAELAAGLHRTKTAVFRGMVEDGRVPLRPGAARLVEELSASGVRLLVATTGSRAWVEPLLRGHFGDDVFELVLTGSEVPDLKPDPAVYEAALAQAELDPHCAVAVEDSANGLNAAKAAGLPCLVVTNGYTAEQNLWAADLVVDGFGPGAHRVSGANAPLPDGAVTVATLAALTPELIPLGSGGDALVWRCG